MQAFPIRTLTETDLDGIVEKAGGIRAHPDADRRNKPGADYVIGGAVVELKMLDDEGFNKPERQAKLASLFRPLQSDRPVVVLDPDLLPQTMRRSYRRIVEQPIKGVVAKSKQQLAQSRAEFPETMGSVLWIVNNGYTALDHATLEKLVANRVQQDTSSIDGVIVSGCYYHSDGFDSILLWPCTYIPIRLNYSFPEFSRLRDAFENFAGSFMTELMLQTKPAGDKFEVCDLVFDVDGVRFIRPAPAMGRSSGFYSNGRPRTNSSGIETCPAMAVIVPGLTRADHDLIGCTIDERGGPLGSWSAWLHHLDGAREAAKVTQPLVTVSVSAEAWLRSCRAKGQSPSLTSLNDYLNESFNQQMRSVLGSAQELVEGGIVPSTYVLAVTQEIGQDRANDVSDIALVRERSTGEPIVRPLAENLRIFREHAIALAAAYALREGVGIVRWNRNRRYGWS